jgi:CRISPR/Cas system CMR-associated protein Cmr5 small subunit
MQYTINAINGGQITVAFADGSYANVAIDPSDTLAIIDEKVGAFTNTYIVDDAPNPNINVGDVRTTIDPSVAEAARAQAIEDQAAAEEALFADQFILDFGNASPYMDNLTVYMFARKLADDGDSTLLDLINARLQTIQDNPDFNLTDLIAAFNDTL